MTKRYFEFNGVDTNDMNRDQLYLTAKALGLKGLSESGKSYIRLCVEVKLAHMGQALYK